MKIILDVIISETNVQKELTNTYQKDKLESILGQINKIRNSIEDNHEEHGRQ